MARPLFGLVLGIALLLIPISASATTLGTQQGGTGTTSPSGILFGNNNATPLSTLTIGSNLTLTGSTLSATGGSGGSGGLATTSPWNALSLVQVVDNGHVTSIATSSLNLTTSSFASSNISQWTNNSGYLTSETDPLSLHLTDWYATSSAPQLTTLANLATVGTISSGIWHGTAIGDTYISSSGNWNTAYTDRITGANYPLSISSNVLSVVATSSEGCTVSCFASHNISQWTNDAGYLTSAGSGNVSTSTGETSGYLAYWTSTNGTPALLGKVATSTLTPSSPLTGSFVQIGSSGSLGCQTASGSQSGCLSSTDWTTFNNKGSGTVTSVGATWPVLSSGGNTPTISWGGLATTSQPSSSNLLVSDGGKGIYGVATSTLTPSAPLGGSFTQVGTGGTLTCATCLTANQTITLSGDVTGSGATSIATAFALGNSHWWTATQNFTNASTSEFTATSTVWFTSLGTPAGTFLAVDPNGKLIATTTPSGGGSQNLSQVLTTGNDAGGQNIMDVNIATTSVLNATSSITIQNWALSTSTSVCSTGCTYTTIQAALNAGWLNIEVKPGVYNGNITIENTKTNLYGDSQGAIIQCNGATQTPCVSFNGLNNNTFSNFTVRELNASLTGTAIDLSNSADNVINQVLTSDFATSTYMHDTGNNTFYNTIENSSMYATGACFDISGTLANDNQFLSNRCQPMALTSTPTFGAYIVDAQVLTFTGDNFEATTSADVTAIYVDPTSRSVTFINPYVEEANIGIYVSAGALDTTVIGGQFSTAPLSDNASTTAFINVGTGPTTQHTYLFGSSSGIAFTAGTTTYSTTGGINLTSGCFAVGGTCITGGSGGSGTVTSVSTDSTLTGGPITTTGTLGINLSNANTWSVLQQFSQASTTEFSSYGPSYFGATGTTSISTTGNVLAVLGSSAAAAYAFSDHANTGMYESAGGVLGLDDAGASVFWNAAALYPSTNNARTLGIVSTNVWNNLYVNYASTTELDASEEICLNGTCKTSWPSGSVTSIASAFPFTTQTITTSGTLGWAGLSTSTNLVTGDLAYSTGVNTLGQVATSAVTISSPLGGSVTQVGTGGTLTCATCLTANQTITLSGAVSGSGATSITTSYAGVLGNTLGGTGQNSSSWNGVAAMNAGVWTDLSTTSLNASITGSSGSVGHSLSNDAATLTGSSFNGSATVSNWAINLGNANAWTAQATTSFAGPIKIATTTATAFVINDAFGTSDLLMGTASTTGPIFAVEATTTGNPTLFSVDQYGNLTASSTGATPAVSSCGTSPSITAGSNNVTGDFTTGTGSPTACTLTFSATLPVTPEVFVQNYSSTIDAVDVTSRSTTGFTVTIAAGVSSDDIGYWIIQP